MTDVNVREAIDHAPRPAHHYWQHGALGGTVSPRVYVGPPNVPTAATSQPTTAQDGQSDTRYTPERS